MNQLINKFESNKRTDRASNEHRRVRRDEWKSAVDSGFLGSVALRTGPVAALGGKFRISSTGRILLFNLLCVNEFQRLLSLNTFKTS